MLRNFWKILKQTWFQVKLQQWSTSFSKWQALTCRIKRSVPAWRARAQSFLHASEKHVRPKCQMSVNSPTSSRTSHLLQPFFHGSIFSFYLVHCGLETANKTSTIIDVIMFFPKIIGFLCQQNIYISGIFLILCKSDAGVTLQWLIFQT